MPRHIRPVLPLLKAEPLSVVVRRVGRRGLKLPFRPGVELQALEPQLIARASYSTTSSARNSAANMIGADCKMICKTHSLFY
jgi:hypothetical protein